MSKPSALTKFSPAVWIVAIAVTAIAVVFAAGPTRKTTPQVHATLPAPTASAEQRGHVLASMSALPLAFEANQGQTDPQVKYLARGNGYTLFLTSDEAVFALRSARAADSSAHDIRAARSGKTEPVANSVMRLHLAGANAHAQVEASAPLGGKTNYFIGNDRSQWHAGIEQFARVSYHDIYPGVNLAFYGAQRQVEFDFIVAPGADVAPIRLEASGARRVATDESGNLVLSSTAGKVTLHKPVAYQMDHGTRQPVEARFALESGNKVGFRLGNYDRSRELVIDPSVAYATYLGGSAEDDGYAIAIDGSGNSYVTGQTMSSPFPTVPGSYSTTLKGNFDAFVTKISADGSSLVYSTYVGGTGADSGNTIAVDGSGDAFVAGGTGSSDFPVSGGFQTTYGGGTLDAFALELNPGGTALTFSTFLGGGGDDVAKGIAIDATGVYVVGSTTSGASGTAPFPTMNAKQPSINGTGNGFVTKLNSSGSALVYSTYLGGGSSDIATAVAVDSINQAYVTGATQNSTFPVTAGAFQQTCGGGCAGPTQDAFVTVYNAAGSSYVYSTFLGGSKSDQGLAIAVDSSKDAYVTGATASNTDFPLKSALYGTYGGGLNDAFVTELNPTGSGLVYSTYLGGGANDVGTSIAVDSNGNAYVTGATNSPDFKLANATQSANKGLDDAFVSEISSGGSSLAFSTYLGGSGDENTSGGASFGAIAVDSTGANIYVTGNTTSMDFPTVSPEQPANGGGIDAFVAHYTTSGGGGGNFTVANGALSTTSGNPGVSATSTITVGSTGGFNSAVSLACTVSPVMTEGPTCGFSNASVTPPANSTVTSTITVSTTPASALLRRPASGRSAGVFYALLLPVGGMVFLGSSFLASSFVGSAGSRRKRWLGLLMLAMVLASLLLMPACGGGSSGGGNHNAGTPAGAYTIMVTGTNSGTVVTGSPTLTLTVN